MGLILVEPVNPLLCSMESIKDADSLHIQYGGLGDDAAVSMHGYPEFWRGLPFFRSSYRVWEPLYQCSCPSRVSSVNQMSSSCMYGDLGDDPVISMYVQYIFRVWWGQCRESWSTYLKINSQRWAQYMAVKGTRTCIDDIRTIYRVWHEVLSHCHRDVRFCHCDVRTGSHRHWVLTYCDITMIHRLRAHVQTDRICRFS